MPLMLKYLFTSEKLSVQVHPNDAQARDYGFRSGKDECWLVMDATEGARIGIGLKQATTADDLRDAVRSGAVEGLLKWHLVSRGDFFYIPAGTVHALGEGITILEIQQNSDATLRLYDYGRPRALHVEQALEIATADTYDMALHRHLALDKPAMLVDGPKFRLKLCDTVATPLKGVGLHFIAPIKGSVNDGDGKAHPGDCLVTDNPDLLMVEEQSLYLIARACA